MDRKIRVAAVSYLNTKPLIYGFEKGGMVDSVELVTDYPAKIASMLVNNEVDISLVPVAIIPFLNEYHIITDYCIGTQQNVASVCLFSDVPLEAISHILLDYQSRSSVGLLKVLLNNYWKISPELIESKTGYEANIKGTTAGLVIGDRAFIQRKKNKYIYDLGTAWKAMTGLPFVFAAWIANKQLPQAFIEKFNEVTGEGFQHLAEIIAQNPYEHYDLMEYYTVNIDYKLDDEKRKGFKMFLNYLKEII
ncbi:menaquinone biosynthetic enzyme MqnA/MqnD family protein [Ferruginibacter yonginensis]|uniref:Chorismate dehydratase n=1 Tax=Ferruginibacter yonginensis TaxID=1310416 RepID=A0ABV8QN21_9BACT